MNQRRYTFVRLRIHEVRPASVLVSRGAHRQPIWLPRSVFHENDTRELAGAFAGEERPIRLAEWKARELGWDKGYHAENTPNLFGEKP